MTTSLQRRQGAPGQRLHSPVSPTPQYDAYGPQLGHLSENIHRLLTERECSIFDRGLADYHRRRNIRSFVECLSLVLNNNQKRQLLLPIRDSYVKPSDLVKFNQLVQDHGLATSLRRKKKEEKTKLGSGVRRLEVKRDPNGEWGFSIRGGSEHGIGVFVSWVEPSSGAHKSGLQVGDQILKTNDVSFENISHYEAVTMLKGVKKASLWVLSRGRVPSSRMTHKVYRWMSPEGRSVSPPPDPFDLQDQTSIGERGVMNEADERKVTMVVEDGHELGISIRGGAEHGLGIYVSVVEEDSVADNYGLKPGDQLLEVNDVKFLNIIHSDAANALRAQRCMVMKVKDVGKIPHSRITTYGQTEWKSPTIKSSNGPQTSSPPVFQSGMGTQVMHGKQQTGSIQGRGLMNEVARSVLNTQELTTFNYYVDQYDQHSMSVENLVAPLLDLLNTPEKLQLLSEVRALIKAHDLQRFNELTVHKEISSKKGYRSHKDTSFPDGSSKPTSPVDMDRTPDVHNGSDDFILSPLPNSPNGHTRPHQGSDISSEEGGRDKVPQKLSPQRPGAKGMFHAPPPPSSPPATSTPDGQSSLAHTLKERRQWMREGTKEQSMDETWDGQWNDSSIMQQHMGADETDGPADISEIEAKVRSETEAQLREEFKEDKRKLMEEQQRLLEQEKQDKEMTLRREREQFQKEMREQEEKVKAEVEERVMMEAEGKIKRELEVKERELTEEFAKRNESQLEQTDFEEQIREIEERTKMEMEEKIWKEAEEQLRHEFDIKIEEEKTKFQSEAASKSTSPETTPNKEAENRLRRELEQKFKQEYDEKMRRERDKMRKQQQDDKKRREDEERAKRQDDIARLEAEEQEKIENEERIRKEADAAARAEYEVRLQKETMERAKLAEEVKARREAEERREAKIKKVKPQMAQTPPVHEDPAEESEEDMPDTEPMHTGPASEEEEKMLEVQRRRREAEEREVEREQRRREAEEQREANQAYSKQEEERQKKLELQRKREENICKREEERKQKDAEARRKRDQQKSSNPSSSTPTSQHTKPKTSEGETRTKSRTNDGETRTKSRTNDGETHTKPKTTEGKPQKSKQQVIEDERRKAEDKLQRRLKKAQEKKQAEETASAGGQGQSYGGYEDLQGRIFNVTVTKVCKKLGIAIDGGANTKQKAVIVREISPEGCAALTGEGLKVGQQILSVGGQCLFNLRHKEVVMAVKSAFEGPLQKTLELVVLDQA